MATKKTSETGMTGHPLFPDKPDAVVEWVHVTRFEGGKLVFAPRKFAAAELTDVEQIYELFGGGQYEVKGRDAKGFTAVQSYNLPGASKPLGGESPAPAPAAPVTMHAPSGGTDWTAVVLGLAGPLLGYLQQSQRSQTELLVAMMTQSKAAGQEHVQMMGQMMTAMVNTQRPPGSPAMTADQFLEAVRMGIDLKTGASEGPGAGGGNSDVDALSVLADAAVKGAEVIAKVKSVADGGGSIEDAAAAAAEG